MSADRAETPAQKRRVVEILLTLWLMRPTERLGQLLLNSVPHTGTGTPDEILADIERHLYTIEDFALMRLVAERLTKP